MNDFVNELRKERKFPLTFTAGWIISYGLFMLYLLALITMAKNTLINLFFFFDSFFDNFLLFIFLNWIQIFHDCWDLNFKKSLQYKNYKVLKKLNLLCSLTAVWCTAILFSHFLTVQKALNTISCLLSKELSKSIVFLCCTNKVQNN